jgi:hypothetical protein
MDMEGLVHRKFSQWLLRISQYRNICMLTLKNGGERTMSLFQVLGFRGRLGGV